MRLEALPGHRRVCHGGQLAEEAHGAVRQVERLQQLRHAGLPGLGLQHLGRPLLWGPR